FDMLLGLQQGAETGASSFSVSYRQTATPIHYGPELSGWFGFRLDLALAHYRRQVSLLVSQLQEGLPVWMLPSRFPCRRQDPTPGCFKALRAEFDRPGRA